MLRVELIQSVILSHHDLRELFKVESGASDGEDCPWVRLLKNVQHLHDLLLIDKAFFEDNGMGDSFHAVLDQELEHVGVWSHVEVVSADLRDDVLDLEAAHEDV